MVSFCSKEELEGLKLDPDALVSRAESYIHAILSELETQRARTNAATLNAEQNCALLEQKYMQVADENGQLEQEKSRIQAELDNSSAELAQAKMAAHQLQLSVINTQGDLERCRVELTEATRGKKELLQMLEQKNSEIEEKNSSIKSYLEKIVYLTTDRSRLEAVSRENEAEVVRSRASLARLTQEKELLEQHNSWLNDEVNTKSEKSLKDQQKSSEIEITLRSKLAQAEKDAEEAAKKVSQLSAESKKRDSEIESLKKELKDITHDSTTQIELLTMELGTANTLLDRYREDSRIANEKATMYEGELQSLQTLMTQEREDSSERLEQEKEYWKERLEESEKKSKSLQSEVEKLTDENAELKAKFEEQGLEIVPSIRALDPEMLQILHESSHAPPSYPTGISGTALAANLIKGGWTLAKMYNYYMEAADAWREEKQERIRNEEIIKKLRDDVRERLKLLREERAEYAMMKESYRGMEQKLEKYGGEKKELEKSISGLRNECSQKQRKIDSFEHEIKRANSQVTFLVKEINDRRHAGKHMQSTPGTQNEYQVTDVNVIKEMVEGASRMQLRINELEAALRDCENELRADFETELQKVEAAHQERLKELMKDFGEQEDMIKTLQNSGNLFKRLYEDEVRLRKANAPINQVVQIGGNAESNEVDYKSLLDQKDTDMKNLREDYNHHLKNLQEDLEKSKEAESSARIAKFRLESELKYQRETSQKLSEKLEDKEKEMEAVMLRNMEFSQTITEYQRRLRESSQAVSSAEEAERRLSIQASVLEREKELLANAEKRSSQEVSSLSQRLYSLQATLDNTQQRDEIREAAHASEKKRLEEDITRLQREWTEGKRELKAEKQQTRSLILARDRANQELLDRLDTATRAVEASKKSASEADARAAALQGRVEELQASLTKSEDEIASLSQPLSESEAKKKKQEQELQEKYEETGRELSRVREDLASARSHVEQYKSIANANEEAAQKIGEMYTEHQAGAEAARLALEKRGDELAAKVAALEAQLADERHGFATQLVEAEQSLSELRRESSAHSKIIATLRQELEDSNSRVTALETEVDTYQKKYKDAQENYQKQVLSQGDTIRELTSVSLRLERAQEELKSALLRADAAEAALSGEKIVAQVNQETVEAAMAESEAKIKELESNNRILLDRLEATAVTSLETSQKLPASEEGTEESKLNEIVRFLRRSKETAETELLLLKQERSRLQRQVDSATREAEDLRSQLRAEMEKSQSKLQSESKFQELQKQIQEMTMLRESNVTLREENRRNFEDAKKLREKLKVVETEMEPMRAELRKKDAEIEGSSEELSRAKGEAESWQRRVKQLLEKYKTVDLEEHEKVKKELADCQESLKAAAAALEEEKVQAARVAESEKQKAVQRQKMVNAKIALLENQKSAAEAKLQEASTRLAEAEKEGTGVSTRLAEIETELKAKSEELTKVKDELRKRHSVYNANKKRNEELGKKVEELSKQRDDASKKLEEERKARESLKIPQNVNSYKVLLEKKDKENAVLQQEVNDLKSMAAVESNKKQAAELAEAQVKPVSILEKMGDTPAQAKKTVQVPAQAKKAGEKPAVETAVQVKKTEEEPAREEPDKKDETEMAPETAGKDLRVPMSMEEKMKALSNQRGAENVADRAIAIAARKRQQAATAGRGKRLAPVKKPAPAAERKSEAAGATAEGAAPPAKKMRGEEAASGLEKAVEGAPLDQGKGTEAAEEVEAPASPFVEQEEMEGEVEQEKEAEEPAEEQEQEQEQAAEAEAEAEQETAAAEAAEAAAAAAAAVKKVELDVEKRLRAKLLQEMALRGRKRAAEAKQAPKVAAVEQKAAAEVAPAVAELAAVAEVVPAPAEVALAADVADMEQEQPNTQEVPSGENNREGGEIESMGEEGNEANAEVAAMDGAEEGAEDQTAPLLKTPESEPLLPLPEASLKSPEVAMEEGNEAQVDAAENLAGDVQEEDLDEAIDQVEATEGEGEQEDPIQENPAEGDADPAVQEEATEEHQVETTETKQVEAAEQPAPVHAGSKRPSGENNGDGEPSKRPFGAPKGPAAEAEDPARASGRGLLPLSGAGRAGSTVTAGRARGRRAVPRGRARGRGRG